MHMDASRAGVALLLLLLCSCGEPQAAAEPGGETTAAGVMAATAQRAMPPAIATECEPDAPESPCPIVGRWRVVRVYNPDNADPLADDREMIGAALSVTPNGAGPGVLQWDGPGNGQFDTSDRCVGPWLTARDQPVDNAAARGALQAALAAWAIDGDAAGIRGLGCDQGQWTVPIDATGELYGLVLPLGDRVAIQWYEGRFLLLDRIG